MNALPISAEAPFASQTTGIPRASSLEANVGWALSGNVLFAACQWGMLIALARLGNSEMVGQFALGLAIATPVMTLANLQLRSVQATDAGERYRFADYWRLRRLTTMLALAVIVVVTLVSGWRPGTAFVVISVGLAKAVESFSDIHYGLFQNREQLAIVAKSLALRGTLGLGALAGALYLTKTAAWAVAALVLAWAAVLVAFDFRRGGDILVSSTRCQGAFALRNAAAPRKPGLGPPLRREDLKLAYAALPLGLVTALVSLQMNVPRYFVEWRAGEANLGIFSAIAYLGTLLTVFIDALGLAMTPRLAKHFLTGQFRQFRSLLARLTALGGAAGAAAILVAGAGGSFILRIAYGSEYAGYQGVFLWLMLAAGIGCLGTLLSCTLTAGGWFLPQVPMYAAVVAAAAAACAALTPRYGLQGAAMAMVVAASVHVALSLLLVARMLATHHLDIRTSGGEI